MGRKREKNLGRKRKKKNVSGRVEAKAEARVGTKQSGQSLFATAIQFVRVVT